MLNYIGYDISLASLTWLKVGGPAQLLFIPKTFVMVNDFRRNPSCHRCEIKKKAFAHILPAATITFMSFPCAISR